ncbi:MAG: response regulator [Chitinophagaceae bacterium]|nr:response regulator [Chitinophagaceae bacterium]
MKPRILIFDDDKEILIVCKIILQQYNYAVETRTCCENIVEDIIKVKPDVVLLDLWIPEIGGEKAIELMKMNKATKDTPVILFSANTEIDEICKRAHANGFLKKPFEIANLLQIIEKNILQIH